MTHGSHAHENAIRHGGGRSTWVIDSTLVRPAQMDYHLDGDPRDMDDLTV
jgi:hypothetical protein